jgi:uncharacterized heparinase superfamily protein
LTKPSRLTDYTRHYHDRPAASLLERWIPDNPPGHGAGWEPYPLSLRMVNWIKWLLGGQAPSERMLASLRCQADWLSRSLEYHLLANHLFVNAKALAFAGAFFQANAWLGKGLEILRRQVPEQVLSDGGHFERSPMYHSLILEDVLDLVNLGKAYPGLIPDWTEPAGRMLGWLRQMLHQDGRISFFNDATFGVAPEPGELFGYGERLGVAEKAVPLSDSGYIRLETDTTAVLFDAAPIGPDYQPGHAHADTLSFELSHRGRRLLVNSGISTYQNGPERQFQRGTAAHNTLRVDALDQSEVWHAFRVARRARPIDVRTDHRHYAEAAHDGYRRLANPVTHTRRIELADRCLTLTDHLEGQGIHGLEVFFHLYPGVSIDIRLDPRLSPAVEDTFFYPRFEQAVPNRTVVGRYRGPCPVTFRTGIPLP